MFLILTSSGLIKNSMLGILVFDTSTYTYEGLGVYESNTLSVQIRQRNGENPDEFVSDDSDCFGSKPLATSKLYKNCQRGILCTTLPSWNQPSGYVYYTDGQ